VSDVEKDALMLDRGAVIRVVSALREYRAAAVQLLGEERRGGAGCDGAALSKFRLVIEDTEAALVDEEGDDLV
jgi:hypothetical protein